MSEPKDMQLPHSNTHHDEDSGDLAWKVSDVIWPSNDDPDPRRLYVAETQGHRRRYRKFLTFTHSSTKAAGIMLLAAIVSLVIANTPAHEAFSSFWHAEVMIGFNGVAAQISLSHVVNDVLMAVFFLLVGLDIKFEMVAGELSSIRRAALPIIAACGGVIAPMIIYSLFNAGNPLTAHGWGIPTATDIAFALGILALLGDRVPSGIRIFLSTLAVADDIIAILIIAIFYGQSPSLLWLGLAAVTFAALVIMNRAHIYSLAPYLLVGTVLWICVYLSGIHSTIAGVLLAFAIPSGSNINLRNFMRWSHDHVHHARNTYDDHSPLIAQTEYMATVGSLSYVAKQAIPPAKRLERAIYPWVYFGILPLFALVNADVSFTGESFSSMVSNPVFLGVFWGLTIGKPLGIITLSFIAVKTKVASLPENVRWSQMLGAAILGGIGFTMAIFVANLAFTDAALVASAKLGILTASTIAGLIGFAFMLGQLRTRRP